jgi:hypothetical protein
MAGGGGGVRIEEMIPRRDYASLDCDCFKGVMTDDCIKGVMTDD